MKVYSLLYVGAGGLVGTILRYITVKFVDEKMASMWPFGTFAVNIIGCLFIGIVYGYTSFRSANTENLRLFLGPGLCGGFTTFSAFALENILLFSSKPAMSLLYVTASVLGGIAAVIAGIATGKML